MNTNKIWMRLLMAGTLLALLFTTACGMEDVMVNAIEVLLNKLLLSRAMPT